MKNPIGKIEIKKVEKPNQNEHSRAVRKLLDEYKDKLPPERIREIAGYSECDLSILKIDLDEAVKNLKKDDKND